MKSLGVIVIVVSLCLGAVCASAGVSESTERAKQRASEYFDRGMILFDAGQYSKAAEAFLLAYETYSHPATLINIALCYERAGWKAKAYTYYRRYLTEVQDAPDADDVKQRLRELMANVGEIIVSCSFEPCLIRVDGSDYGQAPITVVVEPGMRLVEAVYQGQVVEAANIRIDSGGFEEVAFRPEQLPQIAIVPVETDPADGGAEPGGPDTHEIDVPDDGSTQRSSLEPADSTIQLRPPFWVFASGTVAAGITTAVVGGLMLSVQDDFEQSGNTDQDLADRGERLQLATNVMYGVTGAFAVATIIALTVDLVHSKEGPPLSVAVNPTGISLEYRF